MVRAIIVNAYQTVDLTDPKRPRPVVVVHYAVPELGVSEVIEVDADKATEEDVVGVIKERLSDLASLARHELVGKVIEVEIERGAKRKAKREGGRG